MSKPVNDHKFWKARLNSASNMIHQSVFRCTPQVWKSIENSHLNAINSQIKEDDKVLDAACGYGRLAHNFKNYVGVDFSPDFIAEAKKLNPSKEFIQADLKELPFENKTFDWAICSSIKVMIEENCGVHEWELMEKELLRVCNKVLVLEYTEAIDTSNYLGQVLIY